MAAFPSIKTCPPTSTSSASATRPDLSTAATRPTRSGIPTSARRNPLDPLYKSIPFFLAISGGRSYGLFLDNTWRTWFDFGKQARDAYAFGSEGGPLDYYLIYGPTPKQVVEGYAWLTGTPPLPPLWSLGFQQSRYSYTPESQVREVADRLRADKIPSDALYLDIDYQDRNRPFTVNPVTFPNFPGFVSDLRKQNFHLVVITDLHIAHAPNQGYVPYDTGHAGDHFVKNPDGSEFVGVVWPGPAVFPDFTRAQTRAWWGNLYKQFVDDGVAGFWNDMNEPSVFDQPSQNHAARHRPSHRRAGLRHPHRDPRRDPQYRRIGKRPRHLRGPAQAAP